MPDSPGSLTLSESLFRLAEVPIIIASDFDGTLSRIVDVPAEARPDLRALVALEALAELPLVTAAIVSGRRRDELRTLTRHTEGVILIGEHGADTGHGRLGDPELIAEIAARLAPVSDSAPGTEIETKRASVVFHYRRAESDPTHVLEEVRKIASELPGIRLTEGKKVLELHSLEVNKGDAVEQLRADFDCEAVVFIGDDVTDESVFVRLGAADIGVKVGEGDTAAGWRVPDVDAVADLLEEMLSQYA